MPLLGQQPEIVDSLSQIVSDLRVRPTAIVVVSAHFVSTNDGFMVTGSTNPQLLFDYGGFPPESYKYKYDCPGSPELAERICSLLTTSGIPCASDVRRGLDHGVFVPLKIMFPEADIPIVSMSIHHSFDPALHILAGECLSTLRDEGVMVIASGSSFHNFEYFFASSSTMRAEGVQKSRLWDAHLVETLTSEEVVW